jgi:hypothetical protein
MSVPDLSESRWKARRRRRGLPWSRLTLVALPVEIETLAATAASRSGPATTTSTQAHPSTALHPQPSTPSGPQRLNANLSQVRSPTLKLIDCSLTWDGSLLGGAGDSAGKGFSAAEVHGHETPVRRLGDFNDEPFDSFLVLHALSTGQRAKVTSAREDLLVVETDVADRRRTEWQLLFDNQPNMLDQFLANKDLAPGIAPIKVDPATVQIFKLPAMVNTGFYPKPVPFGGMGKPVNQNVFSDHFPITMRVTEVD